MLGARITPEAKSYIDIFFLSKELFLRPLDSTTDTGPRMRFQLGPDGRELHRVSALMNWSDLLMADFRLMLDDSIVQLQEQQLVYCFHVNETSRDINTLEVIHTIRCPMHSSFDVQDKPIVRCRIFMSSVYYDLPFGISVMSRELTSPLIAIPVHSLAVGMGGPVNESPTGFIHRRNIVQLCLPGLNEIGLKYIRDFIKHHLLVGVSSFVLGIHAPSDSTVFQRFRFELDWLIKQGVVSLMSVHIPLIEHISDSRDEMKMLFYQSCLYHGKATSPFTAIWDLDEYWTPRASHELQMLNNSLIRALRTAQSTLSGCPEWCYITFPSYRLALFDFHKPESQGTVILTNRPFLDYKYRFVTLDYAYQKSIINSKMAYHAGFHMPGSCTNDTGTFEVRLSDSKGCAHKVPDLGVMRHFFSMTRSEKNKIQEKEVRLFRHWTLGQVQVEAQVLDEFTAFVRNFGAERLYGKN